MPNEVTFSSIQDPKYVAELEKIENSTSNKNYAIALFSLLVIAGGVAIIATHINQLKLAAVGLAVSVAGGMGGLYGKHRVTLGLEKEKKELLSKIRSRIYNEPTAQRTRSLEPEKIASAAIRSIESSPKPKDVSEPSPKPTDASDAQPKLLQKPSDTPDAQLAESSPKPTEAPDTRPAEPLSQPTEVSDAQPPPKPPEPVSVKESEKFLTVSDLPKKFSELKDLKCFETLIRTNKKEILEFVQKNTSYKNLIVAEALSEHLSDDEMVQFFKDHFVEICSMKIENPSQGQIFMLYKMYTSIWEQNAHNVALPFAQTMGIDLSKAPSMKQIEKDVNLQTLETMQELSKYMKVKEFCKFAQIVIIDLELTAKPLNSQQKSLIKKMIDERISALSAHDPERVDLEIYKDNNLKDVT